MTRKKASDFGPDVLRLFDKYVHGAISRRDFLDKAGAFTVAGVSAAALLESLVPDFARGQRIDPQDERLDTRFVEYGSPDGSGEVRAYLARPRAASGPLPGIVVIHENRGLNPHIEDIARRMALEGFLALAPDALTPLGGYPGDEDAARALFAELDRDKTTEDFVAAVRWLAAHADSTGRVGAVGFCFGGGMVSTLAVRLPELAAGVSFYGGQPATADVARIRAPLQLHFASEDERINAGWPAYEQALRANGVTYDAHLYEGTFHGFNNDTTPRYDEAAAGLAWERTVRFFREHLVGG